MSNTFGDLTTPSPKVILSLHLHINTCNSLYTWKNSLTHFFICYFPNPHLSSFINSRIELRLRLLSLLTTSQNFCPQLHQTMSCLLDVHIFLGLDIDIITLSWFPSQASSLESRNSFPPKSRVELDYHFFLPHHVPNTNVLTRQSFA